MRAVNVFAGNGDDFDGAAPWDVDDASDSGDSSDEDEDDDNNTLAATPIEKPINWATVGITWVKPGRAR